MTILLDTHALLWWFDDPNQISEIARNAIAEPHNVVLISAVSAWEIAIKRKLGKLDAPLDLHHAINYCGFQELSITTAHGLATESLPLHHRDPFDRLLIAQAIVERATIVTRDIAFDEYDIEVIAA